MGKRIVLTIDQHLKNRGLKQKEFAIQSGLREATVSQLTNNKYDRVQLSHLLKVMDTLEVKDFNEIFSIVEDEISN